MACQLPLLALETANHAARNAVVSLSGLSGWDVQAQRRPQARAPIFIPHFLPAPACRRTGGATPIFPPWRQGGLDKHAYDTLTYLHTY